MSLAYIFYVHNTMTPYQIDMAIDSMLTSRVQGDLWLHNSSNEYTDDELLDKLRITKSYFDRVIALDGKGSSVAEDVALQVEWITGYDRYVCHKADFYVAHRSFEQVMSKLPDRATFINYSKFDLRENVSSDFIWELARFHFDQIMGNELSCDMTEATPDDFGLQYDAMGYRGIDGVMHAYNEEARKLLQVDSYWEQTNIDLNRSRGIDMQCGHNDIVALHMFHALPGGRNYLKDVEGYRW